MNNGTMGTNVLVLAAGKPVSDPENGEYPQALAELDGTSLIERIVNNTRTISGARYTFALLQSDIDRFHLDKVVHLLTEGPLVVKVPERTAGSACTALLAASQLNAHEPLIIISANELVDIQLSDVIDDFENRQLDAGTLVFRSVHPRYSYVRLEKDGLVNEAAQQQPISNHATAGIFWFARTADFVNAAKETIRKNANVGGHFYIAPTFNELLLRQARIGVYPIDSSKYLPLKTERQIQQFEHGVTV